MDSARALIARGWGVSLVSRCLRVSRAQLHVILRRTDDWMDGRRSRHTDDTDVLLRIHHVIGELPTYGYRRVWALLRRQAELDGMPAINAKRVYRIMRQNALLLERKPAVPIPPPYGPKFEYQHFGQSLPLNSAALMCRHYW